MKKLLIVDDHRLFAEGIRFLIEHAMEYEVAGVLHTGREVMPFLAANPVHILLLDIELPDTSGFELVKLIRQYHPGTSVLAVSMLSDEQSIDRMMASGAAGYCPKSAGRDELFAAIRAVGAGGNYLPTQYASQPRLRESSAQRHALTGREIEIIQLITAGLSTKQIADRLFLSARTVETHRKNSYRKLGVHTNVELTVYARNNHLI